MQILDKSSLVSHKIIAILCSNGEWSELNEEYS